MFFSEQTIYIEIDKDLLRFLHVESGRTASLAGHYSNARLAIAHFSVAAEAMKKGVLTVYPKRLFQRQPVIVIHQTCNSEGGLCEIEERILTEAGLSAGARQVFIWQGQPLTPGQLTSKIYKNA